jgi:hypothetical protein
MKQRDLELLSSYLDGQLNPSDSARLEARLLTDAELRSVLRDLRSTRSLLRQLPMRKAPRNFRLTPQMVGKNPPLPRAYPAFRFTTALASLLLFISLGLNFLRPQLASAPGIGGGGGGAPELATSGVLAVTEAPAATEAAAAEAPSVQMAPLGTATGPALEDTARAMETQALKNGEASNAAGTGLEQQAPPPASTAPVVSSVWQWLFAGIALISAFIMAMMRQLSIYRWRKK